MGLFGKSMKQIVEEQGQREGERMERVGSAANEYEAVESALHHARHGHISVSVSANRNRPLSPAEQEAYADGVEQGYRESHSGRRQLKRS